ncbi:carboxymuconolactone decarboxylase family protein [Hymenobacter sp. YC55]|uniref:carboxymuconolactone decarboxylase family protein n=1 Tax=Hymenobacter sp. YC55 TaxID=3034019 RepID=UPI0023F8C770|nr:carboxymuconolactone decarboxylase family protein [Hymenobacter sp. YC55]MDF7813716.1 carboxymuconolactone decarboxylase family protein [Hymenobacter sp. YC55]
MSNQLQVLTREQAPEGAKATFDGLQGKLGFVPNLYATFAHSPAALNGSIGFGTALSKGELNGREIETIYLAASEANECDYCVAAHTTVGKLQGLTEEETIAVRTANSSDARLNAVAALTLDIVGNNGRPSQTSLEQFFAAGYSKAALVELIGFVALNTFNNYVQHIAQVPIDWPAAQPLPA